ncbi:MAG: DEAD/DEAH box helicase [Proteobacteria bacterium]|nr:DEAD/DEAH box helicase [Pseudomonadota bacterium]MCG2739092.1 DEAD/DEAH box helicase [Syntrophaceae bacterium]
MIDQFMEKNGWTISERLTLPGREGEYFPSDDLQLSRESAGFLKSSFPAGIYRHQKEAIKSSLEGENICITTGTASGKSLPFYVAAMEKLAADPKARIIVVYPLKALGREQEERWIQALGSAKIPALVGRIDGQTPMHARMDIVRNCRVLIMTPDIIHAWLLFHVSDKAVMCFLMKTRLVIVDEIHYYTGVFGSNAAYLFRRLRHILQLLRVFPQFITASATIAAPENHLRDLFGLDFRIIDAGCDTSPRQGVTIHLADLPAQGDLLTSLSELMDYIGKKTDHKFIAFVDSRKQTEYLASIVSRFQGKDGEDDDFQHENHLEKLNILPYRAGYEEHDRQLIQERLSRGALAGIVSTSALELGLDIPYLTLAILVGVPYSATSFYQRIGRIGRHAPGEVIIVNGGDIHSANIFRDPQQLLGMPLSEGALYLENARVQYIHALCLARHGGEHDRVCSFLGIKESPEFKSAIPWAKGFLELCRSERIGEISPEFQAMKTQAGEAPNHAFPLRDVEIQFQVRQKRGPIEEARGSLSYSQLMREAYPGGIYYYTTKPYRVCRVNIHRRMVEVRHERKYTTKAQTIPTLVFPNLSEGNVFVGKRFGDLIAVESTLQIRESIIGYKERRGPNETSCLYPLDPTGNIYFDFPRFTRNFFTTGVTFTHPAMRRPNVKNEVIAQILFEVFLMVLPVERRDIHFAADRYRVERGPIGEGAKFVAIYDQTYGSLRLSARILEERTLHGILEKMAVVMKLRWEEGSLEEDSETAAALREILACLGETPEIITIGATPDSAETTGHLVRVILPGSKGLNLRSNNEEFFVENVFYSQNYRGPAYRGHSCEEAAGPNSDVKTILALGSLVEIPGESRMGWYNP